MGKMQRGGGRVSLTFKSLLSSTPLLSLPLPNSSPLSLSLSLPLCLYITFDSLSRFPPTYILTYNVFRAYLCLRFVRFSSQLWSHWSQWKKKQQTTSIPPQNFFSYPRKRRKPPPILTPVPFLFGASEISSSLYLQIVPRSTPRQIFDVDSDEKSLGLRV